MDMVNTLIMNNSHKKVCIFGAGVAGLAAAHEAIKMGFQVHVYECDETPGGFAKSSRSATHMPTEYSWRGFGPWYHHVYSLMKETPCRTEDGSVFDKELSRQVDFAIVPDHLRNKLGFRDCFSRLDFAKFVLILLRGCVSDKRGHEHYSTIHATEYLKTRLSSEAYKSVVSTFGPWIGTDSNRTSLHHFTTFTRKNIWPRHPAPYTHPEDEKGDQWQHQGSDGWLILKGPSNEVWFDPWVKYLKKMGVQFSFGVELKKFQETNKSITSAILFSKKEKTEITIKADHYILAITPFASQKVISESSSVLQEDVECQKFNKLIADGPHIQIAFQIGFSEKIQFPKEWQAIILRDSEYCLTIFPDDSIFHKDIDLGKNIKSLWTGTATCTYIPEKTTGLTAQQCSKDDFITAVYRQIFRSKSLEAMIMNANEGRSLQTFPIVQTEIWHDWSFPSTSGTNLVTAPQPKWSNTTNTQAYQPSTQTSFNNLFLAGSHVKISADLWSMEGAAESGRKAAYALNADFNANHNFLQHQPPLFFRICSKMDNVLYRCGLPNLVDVMIGVIISGVLITGLSVFISVSSLRGA